MIKQNIQEGKAFQSIKDTVRNHNIEVSKDMTQCLIENINPNCSKSKLKDLNRVIKLINDLYNTLTKEINETDVIDAEAFYHSVAIITSLSQGIVDDYLGYIRSREEEGLTKLDEKSMLKVITELLSETADKLLDGFSLEDLLDDTDFKPDLSDQEYELCEDNELTDL